MTKAYECQVKRLSQCMGWTTAVPPQAIGMHMHDVPSGHFPFTKTIVLHKYRVGAVAKRYRNFTVGFAKLIKDAARIGSVAVIAGGVDAAETS